ncbi:SDR family NAD(P)-dependent oxidoreductase [Streptomyces sp. NPDC005393]|uniref:SDR family NAD(P)-dependent oxidoreductase n=1 Tax=Streptomyces sp. NPDC005393 TaxID=3157041 RepID=UPI0033B38409
MRTALITGAARGLGRATARELAHRGYRVIATARRRGDLAGLDAHAALELDVTDDASVTAAAAAAGPVDILINNAAITLTAAVEDTPAADATRIWETNVAGPLRTISAFLPSMRERRSGAVINISSGAGRAVLPLSGAYAASKHALEALTEALRLETAPFQVDVVLFQVGAMATGMAVSAPRRTGSAYADLHRRRDRLYARGVTNAPSAQEVAVRLADTLETPRPALRVPADDAVAALIAQRANSDDAGWQATVASMLESER